MRTNRVMSPTTVQRAIFLRERLRRAPFFVTVDLLALEAEAPL
jgi:hypothetical protein